MRSSSTFLDGYGCEIQKVIRCRPAISNETILASRPEIILKKVAPLQSTTNTVLLVY